MTTIKKISNHTGLSPDRITAIIADNSIYLDEMDIDTARLEIIKAIRAGASGNPQKEVIETVTANLIQAKRIKNEAIIKVLRVEINPKSDTFKGYFSDDTHTKKYKDAETKRNARQRILRNMIDSRSPEPVDTVILI